MTDSINNTVNISNQDITWSITPELRYTNKADIFHPEYVLQQKRLGIVIKDHIIEKYEHEWRDVPREG